MPSHPSSSTQIALGPLRIDTDRGTVEVAGEASGLTPRAEQLLVLLARHPNQLVTRAQILDAVWAGRVVEDAAVSHCVWQIRRLLGDADKARLQTRARRGYVLRVGDADRLPSTEPVPTEAFPDPSPAAAPAPPVEVDPPAAVLPSPSPASSPSSPRRIRLRGLALPCVVLALAAGAWFGFGRYVASREAAAGPIVLRSDTDLRLALVSNAGPDWLPRSLLRTVVGHAYLRGGGFVRLQAPPRTDPFAGPLLRIEIAADGPARVVVDMTLSGEGRHATRRFAGPPSELPAALDAWLDATLLPHRRSATPASDALVAGLAADAAFDGLGAIGEYRRALGLAPASVDAGLAMAKGLTTLGDSLHALEVLGRLRPAADWTPRQRCDHALLVADAMPERLPADACELARIRVLLQPAGAGEARRRLDAVRARSMGATRWFQARAMAIEASQYLGEHAEAEGLSADAERIAAAAGWRWAQWRLAAERCKSVLYTGRNEEGLRLCNASADALEATGDALSALAPRTFALGVQRPEPGPATTAQRAVYRHLVDRARSLGSPFAEVWALDGLMVLDRDDPVQWAADKARIETLIAQDYVPAQRERVRHDLITEDIARRQYRAVLAQLAPGDDALGTLYLRAQALFALDDLPGAIAQIDAMERHGYDIAETNPCLFAWLFVQAGDADRARIVLKGCPFETWDPAAIGGLRGDWGLLAKAGLYRLAGEPERAWPAIRPRLDALLATPNLGRLDAEGLVFLARHATGMPGADRDRLHRALSIASALAARDGAGPNLRFGVHVLRWRLCRSEGRGDCGPVLPAWAPEDRLEARLAREATSD